MTEHPVLDLVPLARARREVAHRDREPQEIGQLLDRYLPKPGAMTVTAPGIRRDQEPLGGGIDSRRPIVAHLQMSETCVSGAFPSHPCVPWASRRGTGQWRP